MCILGIFLIHIDWHLQSVLTVEFYWHWHVVSTILPPLAVRYTPSREVRDDSIWGIEPANEADLSHSEEELRMLVDASQKHGYLDKMEGKLLDNVFEFSDRNASEVMVPRQDMVCIFIQDTFEEILEVIKKYGHTRYVLCDDDKDNVLGLVHMRDIIRLQEQSGAKDITKIMRDILQFLRECRFLILSREFGVNDPTW